jgi:sigma-B regulation protein RsbU (phosphoserine phosphatase)
MTIRRQMILLIAVPTLIIYIAILGLAMLYSYQEAKSARQRIMRELADSYASRLDGHLREVAQIAETTAGFVQTLDLSSASSFPEEKIYDQLQRDVTQSPFVYGACMAFEPGTIKPPELLFAPYVCRNIAGQEGYRRVNIDRSVYDWYRDPRYTWFTQPKSLGRGVWSDPYFDEGAGNILMATYSAIFSLGGKFGGVSTVDIDLPRLQNTVARDFEQDLDFVILTGDGRFVYDPLPARIMRKTIFDIATETNQPELAALGRRMLQGTSGTASIKGWDSPEPQWVVFAPIRSARWVFACRFPEKRILADVRNRALGSAGALGLTLLLIVGCIVVVSRRVTAPIGRLKEKVLEVGAGHLDTQIDESVRADELRHLAVSFNRMTSELRSHVQRLATEQAARQRIEHDLDIAREIQRGLLPTSKPNVPGYELAGWSLAADKTGGDYYDWQTLSEGKTLVTLADVSGHGVGPALVTAVCRAYVRASFAAGREFVLLMNQLNDLMIGDLPENRFVTFAAALIDPPEPRVQMISAGHGPIFHYVAGKRSLTEYDANDVPLGVMAQTNYGPAVVIDMQPGDMLLFITDGFFEWAREDGQDFGLQRLREAVIEGADVPLERMISGIYEKVKSFVAGAAQADDMTAVVIRRRRE